MFLEKMGCAALTCLAEHNTITHMGEYSERRLDEIFFALSHRTRRRLLQQIASAPETRVTELARRHRISLNTVSKHVSVLQRARLVHRRVSGRDHFIRIDPSSLSDAETWLRENREFWNDRLDRLASFFERKTNPLNDR
jgi:DNA-binding transcriptional ArsR family regulator